MAEQTRGDVLVAASMERVSAVIADLARYPEWTDGMGKPDLIESDELGRPLLAEFEVVAGPVKDKVRLAYQWGDSDVAWHLVTAAALKALNGKYTWSAEGDGVRVVYELQMDLSKPLPGLVRKMAERAIISSALQGLKRQAEANR